MHITGSVDVDQILILYCGYMLFGYNERRDKRNVDSIFKEHVKVSQYNAFHDSLSTLHTETSRSIHYDNDEVDRRYLLFS